MAVTKILGQAKGTTGEVQIYQPAAGIHATNLIMIVCNVDAAASHFTIWMGATGAISDDGEALYHEVVIAANTTVRLPLPPLINSSGEIGVACEVANDCTFTLYGTEIAVA